MKFNPRGLIDPVCFYTHLGGYKYCSTDDCVFAKNVVSKNLIFTFLTFQLSVALIQSSKPTDKNILQIYVVCLQMGYVRGTSFNVQRYRVISNLVFSRKCKV